jgi:hypothetical protein
MEKVFKLLEVTPEEAEQMDQEGMRMMQAIQLANEKIVREQTEIEQLQKETRGLLTQMKERQLAEAII